MIFVPIHEYSLNLLVSLLLFIKYVSRRKYVPAITEKDAIIVPKDLLLWTVDNHSRPTIPEIRNTLPKAKRNTALILCFSVCT